MTPPRTHSRPTLLPALLAALALLLGAFHAHAQPLRQRTDLPAVPHPILQLTLDGRTVALATVIPPPDWLPPDPADPDHPQAIYLLTKASETPRPGSEDAVEGSSPLRLQTPDGSTHPVQSLALDRDTDLRLLRVHLPEPPTPPDSPPDWSLQRPVPPVPPGTLLLIPTPDRTLLAIVAGPPRPIPSSARMGIFFADASPRPVIRSVQPGSGADRANLQPGDTLLTLDGQPTPTPLAVIEALQSTPRFAGDTVQLTYLRNHQTLTATVTLSALPSFPTSREQRLEQQTGPTSARRDGFPLCLPTDAPLPAHHVGGPAYSLNGQFLGLTIARHHRTQTLLLPPPQLTAALQRMRIQANLEPPMDTDQHR